MALALDKSRIVKHRIYNAEAHFAQTIANARIAAVLVDASRSHTLGQKELAALKAARDNIEHSFKCMAKEIGAATMLTPIGSDEPTS